VDFLVKNTIDCWTVDTVVLHPWPAQKY